jgi:hypothetical protein
MARPLTAGTRVILAQPGPGPRLCLLSYGSATVGSLA